MASLACAVCNDTGLLLDAWCPLCEGFGYDDWLDMQQAQCPVHKGRLLVRRLTRVFSEHISVEDLECIEEVLLSKAQRRKKNQCEEL